MFVVCYLLLVVSWSSGLVCCLLCVVANLWLCDLCCLLVVVCRGVFRCSSLSVAVVCVLCRLLFVVVCVVVVGCCCLLGMCFLWLSFVESCCCGGC